MDSPAINLGSFCTGVGWLDIAVQLACEHVGIRTSSVFACEWEAYSSEVLRSRMEEKSVEPCPIWCGDLRDFQAERFRGLVDAVAFGFPCQDISCAGQGAGIHGKRSGVFFDILAKCCDMGCRILFMENVAAITTRGLDTVLGSLSDCGFDAEWTNLSASEVGASHRRERWFCLAIQTMADTKSTGRQLLSKGDRRKSNQSQGEIRRRGIRGQLRPSIDEQSELRDKHLADSHRVDRERWGVPGVMAREEGTESRQSLQRERNGHATDDCGDNVALSTVGGQRELREPSGSHRQSYGIGSAMADITSGKSQTGREQARGGPNQSGRHDGSLPIFAPSPQSEHWGRIIANYPHLAPAIKPGFCVLPDGRTAFVVDESRADQLRCAGNGVCILQAAVAFVGLMRRIGIGS